ncbi:unnamed protein product [Dibothriocephalus latus]|uniref:Tetratricopeptide repeat protein 7 N-terminal domain-containing protein n=1 Tax=Dibothriocephalus latus TaxID=60516 RepID=A0A3P7NNN2_DIBLA|nr:unnamed protein product [Dibothriocephalus latus]
MMYLLTPNGLDKIYLFPKGPTNRASQEVILNRSAELSKERQRTVNEAIAVYDLLAIALVRKGCFAFLSKTLERALKFAYCEFQIWYQFALSLISSRKYYRAYLILRECQRIDPSKPSVYLLASSLCLGHLHLIEEGMVFASKGIEVTVSFPCFLCLSFSTYNLARSNILLR